MKQLQTESPNKVILSNNIPSLINTKKGDLAFGDINGIPSLYGNDGNQIIDLLANAKGKITATTFYVDSVNGSDSSLDPSNESTPFQTLAALQAWMGMKSFYATTVSIQLNPGSYDTGSYIISPERWGCQRLSIYGRDTASVTTLNIPNTNIQMPYLGFADLTITGGFTVNSTGWLSFGNTVYLNTVALSIQSVQKLVSSGTLYVNANLSLYNCGYVYLYGTTIFNSVISLYNSMMYANGTITVNTGGNFSLYNASYLNFGPTALTIVQPTSLKEWFYLWDNSDAVFSITAATTSMQDTSGSSIALSGSNLQITMKNAAKMSFPNENPFTVLPGMIGALSGGIGTDKTTVGGWMTWGQTVTQPHNTDTNRDANDCHPIGAITGLQAALNTITPVMVVSGQTETQLLATSLANPTSLVIATDI